jgi:hypothetical protein
MLAMRALLVAFLLLAVSLITDAEDAPKPNTLSATDSADGWISLFDGETTFGWNIEGDAKIEKGALVIGGAQNTTASTTAVFGDFDLEVLFAGRGLAKTRLILNDVEHPCFSPDDQHVMKMIGKCIVRSEDRTHTVKLQCTQATEIKGFGVKASGTFGLKPHHGDSRTSITFSVPAESKLILFGAKVKPHGLKPIFNGKDLTGWKEIAGHKSKFSVTPEGELSIIDGNGDLQTTEQWDDFLLQLEIKSNGDHLNSGVFFRCIPDQFWSGYEAQVRNEWKGDDRTKPVDFGTGGLYNRQPARKVVSSDREWFTMTVLAHGTYIAIWVNGYQTVDFTETRPLGNNARRGGKVNAGPISLQGHDPTTNLLFRNIRIASLPKATQPTPPTQP